MTAILAAAVLAFSGRAAAQDLRWTQQASTSSVELGMPFAISGTLESDAPQDLALDIPASSTDSYSISSAQFGKTKLAGTSRLQSFEFEVVPLALGRLGISTAWILGPQARRVQSPPVWVEVTAPALAPDARPRDIKAPRSARPPLWPWLLLAALLAVGYGVYKKLSRRRAAAAAPEAVVDRRPPEIIAEAGFAELEASDLWGRGRYKEFYVRLTDILRQYLERRYGVAAMQMTSAELHRQLRQAELDRALLAKSREIFEHADLTKFAKLSPEPHWGGADLESSRAIVRQSALPQKDSPLPLR